MSEGKVINFQAKRNENIEKKRRSFERILFQNFLGAYTVIADDETVYPVQLVDLSHDGCLFQVPWNEKKNKKIADGTEVKMRMYFTKHSYVPVIVKVRYGNTFTGDDGMTYMHYGCEFDQSMPTFNVMKDFINFMYSFAENSVVDHGDARSYFL
jgi:hypothetical protein